MDRTSFRIYRTADLPVEAFERANMLEELAKAREILAQPMPDTFLGRQIHEPVPLRGKDE